MPANSAVERAAGQYLQNSLGVNASQIATILGASPAGEIPVPTEACLDGLKPL